MNLIPSFFNTKRLTSTRSVGGPPTTGKRLRALKHTLAKLSNLALNMFALSSLPSPPPRPHPHMHNIPDGTPPSSAQPTAVNPAFLYALLFFVAPSNAPVHFSPPLFGAHFYSNTCNRPRTHKLAYLCTLCCTVVCCRVVEAKGTSS